METKQLCHRLFPWGSRLSVSPHLLFIRDTQITDILHHKAMTHTHHLCIWNKKGWGKNNTHTHTRHSGNTYVLTLLHLLQICVNYMHILYAYLHRIIVSVFSNYRMCMTLLRCLFQTMTDVHRAEQSSFLSGYVGACLCDLTGSPHYISGRLWALIGLQSVRSADVLSAFPAYLGHQMSKSGALWQTRAASRVPEREKR